MSQDVLRRLKTLMIICYGIVTSGVKYPKLNSLVPYSAVKIYSIQLFNAYEGNRLEYFAQGVKTPQEFYCPEANGRGQ